jgi:hypothetical protein
MPLVAYDSLTYSFGFGVEGYFMPQECVYDGTELSL